MCGIAGSLNWENLDKEINVTNMIEQLVHRGPDAGAVKTIGPAIFGHRRLSIIDTRAVANQPMFDVSGKYAIAFNGEIYNFLEIKKELIAHGAKFVTDSDTEVVLEAWKRWGVDCLQHLAGMFAFALWDDVRQEMVLARDRMGEKPLFYMPFRHKTLSDGVIFSSELNSLAAHPEYVKDINFAAINQFITFNYILTDQCIVDHCHKLPPAHYILFKRKQTPILVKYWDLATSFKDKKKITETAAIDELNFLLERSIKQQSISDVPLGAFLSGGLDSSSIVATMSRKLHMKNLQTYSIDFKEETYSELEASSQVANFLGLEHHVKTVDGNMAEILPKLVHAAGEPFADSSMIPTFYLAQFAREKLTVCLSGDGGDELFLGYDTYIADYIMQYLRYIPLPMRKVLFGFGSKLFPTKFDKVSLDSKLKRFANGCMYDYKKAHYMWRIIFSEEEKKCLFKPEYHDLLAKTDPYLNSYEKFYQDVSDCHILDQVSYVDMKTWMVDDILVKVDRMTMQNSLEVRAPFLDHRLVEFAASLPVNLKLKYTTKKYILKKSQEDRLPPNIINRGKRGFNSPVSIWLKNKLHSMATEITLDPILMQWFNRSYIERLWYEHNNMIADHGFKLFGLLCFGLWLRNS